MIVSDIVANNSTLAEIESLISLKDNFEKEYRSFIKNLDKKGLPKVERTKEIIKWLDNSLLFEATDEYWMNTEPSGINFDEFYNSGSSMIDMFHMNMLESRYKELALQKRLILRKYKLKKALRLSVLVKNKI